MKNVGAGIDPVRLPCQQHQQRNLDTHTVVRQGEVVSLTGTEFALLVLLAREPGNGALLELPTGWRNGARVLGRSDILIMMQQWRQTAHGKPRLGGNTSRNPPQKFQYFTEHPLIGDLIALMNSDQPGLESMAENECEPLSKLTGGVHQHTLEIPDETDAVALGAAVEISADFLHARNAISDIETNGSHRRIVAEAHPRG